MACMALPCSALPCSAQSDRYELGKRLRRFEVAWQTAETKHREASTEPMQKAVQSFFSLQFAKAAAQLDAAYFAVRNANAPTDIEQLVISHSLQVQPVVVDTLSGSVNVTLRPFTQSASLAKTETMSDTLAAAKVTVKLIEGDGTVRGSFTLDWFEATAGKELTFREMPEGDYGLQASVEVHSEKFLLPAVQVSFIDDLAKRLEKIELGIQVFPKADISETNRLTVRSYAQTLRSQVDKRPLETDFPTARLLRLAEELMSTPDKAAELFRQPAQESIWMTLSHSRRSVAVRVHMPAQSPGVKNEAKKRPVLLAFHGAGGSENMFFETYGAGRLVELASQRGWIVVAPRHPLLGMPLNYREMIEVLSHYYPIDTERVFLVGHSMGAAEVVRQVSLAPTAPQAAVAIGGGGNAKDVAATKSTPWLVAAGELDFGRGGAKSLAKRLEELGCQVEYRDYPKVEHMVIVQAALDEVFAFLDKR